ncbi:MAG TPA: aldehyde dehydrogenase family protein, partial [Longimicrobiales bacterium]|nr:aldehyde dehydrogenase family protein [Longimicrobiales bacterium]
MIHNMLPEYKNEPFTDFSDPANIKLMEAALEKVKSELGQTYPLVIGGKEYSDGPYSESISPFDSKLVVGRFPKATVEQANQAVEVAHEAFKTWSKVEPEARADYVFKCAAAMRRKKHELAAWMIYEVSKSWVEADVDIAEL